MQDIDILVAKEIKKSAVEGMIQVLSREISSNPYYEILAYRSGFTGCRVISLHTWDCPVFGSGWIHRLHTHSLYCPQCPPPPGHYHLQSGNTRALIHGTTARRSKLPFAILCLHTLKRSGHNCSYNRIWIFHFLWNYASAAALGTWYTPLPAPEWA